MNYRCMEGSYFVSEPRVLRSAAGYYVGRVCIDPAMPEAGLNIPYDRESVYFAGTPEATNYLHMRIIDHAEHCYDDATIDAVNAYIQALHDCKDTEDAVAAALDAYDHIYVDQGLVALFS